MDADAMPKRLFSLPNPIPIQLLQMRFHIQRRQNSFVSVITIWHGNAEGDLYFIADVLQHQTLMPANGTLHRREIVPQARDYHFRFTRFDVRRKFA